MEYRDGCFEFPRHFRLKASPSVGNVAVFPERTDEIMVFSSYSSAYVHRPRLEYVDVVREAYRALCQVVAARVGALMEEANTIVATAADIRNCAIYGLGGYIVEDPRRANTSEIAVVAALAKGVFVD